MDLLTTIGEKKNGPIFIIFTETFTERLAYTCGFIFKEVLKVDYTLTNSQEEFEKSKHFKINYSSKSLSSSFWIIPQNLLFEKNVSSVKPAAVFKSGMIYFYSTEVHTQNQAFHFDIFSAVFYFISRCEEWQPYEKDKHGRFEAAESLFFQNGFHLKPAVDLWISEFKKQIEKIYPELRFPSPDFKIISTIDIDNLFAYKNKGILRTLAASAKDLLRFDLKNLGERISVVSGSKKDPFDIYEAISGFCSECQIPLVYFFLLRSSTTFDRTINPRSPIFEKVFNILKDNKAQIGLHPSYDSAYEKGRLQSEVNLINKKSGGQVEISRQHFLRLDIKTTPALLLENGIKMDCSMGFASSPGFRAGTAHPFFYYDFSEEKKSELLFLPFCAMDGAYLVYNKISPEKTFDSMFALAKEIKKTGGYFVTIFHERTFSDHLYPGFGNLYKKLHLKLKEL